MSNYFEHLKLLKLGIVSNPEKVKKQIQKQSPKRKAEQPVYRKIVAKVLDIDNRCKVNETGCQKIASGMQHIKKRSPATWLKEDNLIPCCDNCQTWIENNPLEAIEKGYSKSKF